MDTKIEELNHKAKADAQLAVKCAMDLFYCNTVEELRKLCVDIINAIDYLNT